MTHKHTPDSYLWPSLLLAALVVAGWSLLIFRQPPDTPDHWINEWKSLNSFSLPRRALAATASKTHIYVLGGVDSNGVYALDTEFAPINQDGSLGLWQKTTALPQGRFYVAAAVVGHFIFAVGGGTGPIGDDNQPTNRVERAHINSDGSLGTWEPVSSMQLPRRGLKTVVLNNRIYAIGGYSGVFLKSTEYTTVNTDGSLSPWKLDPEESNLDRYIHSVASSSGRIYLLGGHVQNSSEISYGDVESSLIQPGGELGPWEIEPTKMLHARFIASSFALKSWLYVLGGHNGGNRLKSVEFARVFSSGQVGNWIEASPLTTPRSAAATVVSGDFAYVLGGMGEENALNSVEMATVTTNGQLGHVSKN